MLQMHILISFCRINMTLKEVEWELVKIVHKLAYVL